MKVQHPRFWGSALSVAILFVLFTAVAASAADRAVVHSVRATYPEMARRMHVAGTVKLGVHISPDGSVRKVDVLGGHPLLAQAAAESVKHWKYQPGADETRTVNVDFNMGQ